MDIAIRYPQIINLGDEERQIRINDLIRSEAVPASFSITRTKGSSRCRSTINTWQSDNLLSIQYSGVGYVEGSPHLTISLYDQHRYRSGEKSKVKGHCEDRRGFCGEIPARNIRTVSPHPGALSGKRF
jgi:hypothetical protein